MRFIKTHNSVHVQLLNFRQPKQFCTLSRSCDQVMFKSNVPFLSIIFPVLSTLNMMTQKAFSTGSPFPPLAPGKMRVYSMRFCPYAQRTLLVLTHKNIDFETVNIDLKQKPTWFLDRNPLGKVPVLEHDGKVIYESLVTADYLDDVYPDNRLTPSDPYRRAQDRLVLESFSKVTSMMYKIYKESYRDEDVKIFRETLDKFEQVLVERKTKFFGGDRVQMVDLMMWPHFERFGPVGELKQETLMSADRYPTLTRWMDSMWQVPAVQKCRLDKPTFVSYMKTSVAGNPDYDLGL